MIFCNANNARFCILCLPLSSMSNTWFFKPFKSLRLLAFLDFNKGALLAAGEVCLKLLVVSDDVKVEEAEAVA